MSRVERLIDATSASVDQVFEAAHRECQAVLESMLEAGVHVEGDIDTGVQLFRERMNAIYDRAHAEGQRFWERAVADYEPTLEDVLEAEDSPEEVPDDASAPASEHSSDNSSHDPIEASLLAVTVAAHPTPGLSAPLRVNNTPTGNATLPAYSSDDRVGYQDHVIRFYETRCQQYQAQLKDKDDTATLQQKHIHLLHETAKHREKRLKELEDKPCCDCGKIKANNELTITLHETMAETKSLRMEMESMRKRNNAGKRIWDALLVLGLSAVFFRFAFLVWCTVHEQLVQMLT